MHLFDHTVDVWTIKADNMMFCPHEFLELLNYLGYELPSSITHDLFVIAMTEYKVIE